MVPTGNGGPHGSGESSGRDYETGSGGPHKHKKAIKKQLTQRRAVKRAAKKKKKK
jgi:hypothetical protein